jgi:hypothetical protein
MARKNQMIGLMQLAWDRCEQDFKYVFIAVIGAICTIFLLVLSFWIGVTNAFCFALFFLIIVCLADYALTFISVCYHYDNKSWESAKLAIRMGKTINTLWNNFINGYIALVKKNRNDIQNKIKKSEKELDEEILQLKFDAEL